MNNVRNFIVENPKNGVGFKTIYIKQKLNLISKKQSNKNIQLVQDIQINQSEINNNQCGLFLSSNLMLNESIKYDSSSLIFNDNLSINNNFNINYLSQIFDESISIYDTNLYDNKFINKKIFQSIQLSQSWFQSDVLDEKNTISFTINADIIVNDIIYSTINIKYYTFDIFDSFSFFNNDLDNVKLNSIKQKFSQKYIVDKQQLLQFNKLESENQLYQKVNLKQKKYRVYDEKYGIIINNKINLNQGIHTFIIKRLNTPKSYRFTIKVVNPYYKENDQIYYINSFARENAKLLSYYDYSSQAIKCDFKQDDIVIN